jgi:hypothetical protein
LPGLSGERLVQLRNGIAVLDAVAIGNSRHVPWLETTEGRSLERTAPEPGSPWVSASGMPNSTPGACNTQWGTARSSEAKALICTPSTIRLHPAPPPNAAEVRWKAPARNTWKTTCTAYDRFGQPVHSLEGSSVVEGGAEGVWTWDGRRAGCCPVPPGIYFVCVQACAAEGPCDSRWTSLRVAP